MGGINLNKKLWRMPQKGMVRGVCAGIADYLDVPVKTGAYSGRAVDFLWAGVFYRSGLYRSVFCTGPYAG